MDVKTMSRVVTLLLLVGLTLLVVSLIWPGVAPGGVTHLGSCMRSFVAQNKRRGLAVLVIWSSCTLRTTGGKSPVAPSS